MQHMLQSVSYVMELVAKIQLEFWNWQSGETVAVVESPEEIDVFNGVGAHRLAHDCVAVGMIEMALNPPWVAVNAFAKINGLVS